MIRTRSQTLFAIAVSLSLLLASTALGQAAKKELDHDSYDLWKSNRGQALSNDGGWLLYMLAPQDGDSELVVRNIASGKEHRIERGSSARFSPDSKFLVCIVAPPKEEMDKAIKDKVKADERPKNSLAVLDLASGEVTEIERVQSFSMPAETGEWIAYKPIKPPASEEKKEGEEKPPPALEDQEPEQEKQEPEIKKRGATGAVLVIRHLASQKEIRSENVLSYTWSEDGRMLVYVVSAKEGKGDGVFAFFPDDERRVEIFVGMGDYKQVSIHEEGNLVAFLTNRDDYGSKPPTFALYMWDAETGGTRMLADAESDAFFEGWGIGDRGRVYFSKNGGRVFFATAPLPDPPPEKDDDENSEEEEVKVDIWNWKDPYLQPMQLKRATTERNRTYLAAADLDSGEITQLAAPELQTVNVGTEGDADVAIGIDSLPYRQLVSWDGTYNDIYLVNVRDGSRQLIRKRSQGSASLSPSSRYAVWFDNEQLHWIVMDVRSGKKVNLTERIPHPIWNELNDRPMPPRSYGTAGWTSDESRILLYDMFDIWSVDPTGAVKPENVTRGVGRRQNIQFRYVRVDPDERTIDPSKPMLLRAFHNLSKAAGFYRLRMDGGSAPERLTMLDKSISTPRKAKDAGLFLFTQQRFDEFPDLWVSDLDFRQTKKVTNANPQQADYNWGTSELVEWVVDDGEKMQGILYKPEDFDYGKQYPMMVYIYERLSNGLHRYYSPSPGGSSINTSFYVSRGYIVFKPDIKYKVGYPGESSLQCVVPGIQAVLARGYVDPKRIGIQGHSWGGYEIAYMITRTNIFACAEAGAPVSNMFSAYGGIRWGSGMSRAFQYEKTQSRIGGSIWEYPMRYFENSPIFWADRVNTPLLMLHNDNDGAVPWYQGIELFTALRRLAKPVWMLNYNGEGHGLSKRPNRKDWTIRLQQFFDHYLKDAPVPVWMAEGVPAVSKGKTLGLEPANGGGV